MRGLTGIGLRSEHYPEILSGAKGPPWFEAISENYMGMGSAGGSGGRPIRVLERVRSNYSVALHGVSMSLGSADPLDVGYLSRLKRLADRIEPLWVSDHLSWSRSGGRSLHDLLPIAFTEENLARLVSRVSQAQDTLGRRILVENISAYVGFEESTIPEPDFLGRLARASGCGLLVDINNIYVNSVNFGFSATDFLRALPAEPVAYFHLAGHSDMGTHLFDTHDHPVCDPVWALFSEALDRFGNLPAIIERDDRMPPLSELLAEASRADELRAGALGRPGTSPMRARGRRAPEILRREAQVGCEGA